MKETILMPYSEDRSISSLVRYGQKIYFGRQEAFNYAQRSLAIRCQKHTIEIADMYVEGDDQYGVIMAIWKMVKIEFTDATITITSAIGKSEKPGKIAVDTGLGYWIDTPDVMTWDSATSYIITHIPSGYTFNAFVISDEEVTQRAIAAIAHITNWNRPLAEIVRDEQYKKIINKVDNVLLDLVCGPLEGELNCKK